MGRSPLLKSSYKWSKNKTMSNTFDWSLSVGMAIPLTRSRISLALWLYTYRENTLLGTPGSFAKLKFSCVRLGGE